MIRTRGWHVACVCGAVALSATAMGRDHQGDDDWQGDEEDPLPCPMYTAKTGDLTVDEFYGNGAYDLMTCVQNPHPRVVFAMDKPCRGGGANPTADQCGSSGPYLLVNINNTLNDYEITHGLSPDDYDVEVVAFSQGLKLLVEEGNTWEGDPNGPFHNDYAEDVAKLIERGVVFEACMNTTAKFMQAPPDGPAILQPGHAIDGLIDGVGLTTAGVTRIIELQQQGYSLVNPNN